MAYWHPIPIVHPVVYNRRADAAPQRVAGNAQTTSSRHACHNHQFQLVSHYATVRGVVTWLNLLERRNDGINGQKRGIIRNMQGYVKRWISLWPRRISALTLCQDNYAVLSKNLPANFPNWSLVEATGQEESRTAERRSPRKTIRRWRSGSRLSAEGSGMTKDRCA